MGSPSQDRDAGSNPAGATILFRRAFARNFSCPPQKRRGTLLIIFRRAIALGAPTQLIAANRSANLGPRADCEVAAPVVATSSRIARLITGRDRHAAASTHLEAIRSAGCSGRRGCSRRARTGAGGPVPGNAPSGRRPLLSERL